MSVFRGPPRKTYTLVQFAESYNVAPERVLLWCCKGFLRWRGRLSHPDSLRITEGNRRAMERMYGIPEVCGDLP